MHSATGASKNKNSISSSRFIREKTKPSSHQTISTVADVVAATQAGTQIGPKARNVLAYLNTIRSIEHETHTVPVGYGQISAQVGVDSDYLRRKALPSLAMLGFIAIAKSLEGTVSIFLTAGSI
jgi:hypothetical protein